MLARITRIWHLLETALWVVLGGWLVLTHQWSILSATIAALIGALGLRVLLNALSFLIAERFASARPHHFRIGPLQQVGLVLRESWIFTSAYAWHQMFPARFGREGSADTVKDAPIVLLVHGYFCNGGVWARFARWFEDAGFQALTVSLEPVLGELDAISRSLERRIEEIARLVPGKPIHLVCHSMGGLVTRAYVRRCGMARLGRIVTLGTPHQGTVLAPLGLGENARQMRRCSAWMSDPSNQPDLGDALAVITYDDNLVSPREGAALPSMRVHALAGIGHLSLTASRTVFERVLEELRR